MPTSPTCRISSLLTSLQDDIEAAMRQMLDEGLNPDSLLNLETRLHHLAQELAQACLAQMLAWLLHETALDRQAVRAFRDTTPGRWRDEGRRVVKVHMPSGAAYAFEATYLRPTKTRRRGPAKKRGKRGPAGQGRWPVLELLGIHVVHGRLTTSPLLEDRLIYALTASDSHEAARQMLAQQGLDWYAGRLQNFFERAGAHYREQRQQWLEHHPDQGPVAANELVGQRVQIAVDGGRCRRRQNKPGPARASGYHGFEAPWKEPRLFSIYLLDEHGRRLKGSRPILDGVFPETGDKEVAADALFELLEAYLSALSVDQAAEVIVSGDGAEWIWKRMEPMLERLGVEAAHITQVLDWYHASQTVWQLSHQSGWKQGARVRWAQGTLKALAQGDIDRVVEQVEQLHQKTGAKDAPAKCLYFKRNEDRMQYARFKRESIPRGSGVIESAIRRVINLRIKSNAKYWSRENVETMLMWRGYLKSGRLHDLTSWSRRFRARWWTACDQRCAQDMLQAA